MRYKFKPDYIMDKHSGETAGENHSLLKKIELENLLSRAKIRDKTALDEICRRFDGMVVNLASSFYIEGYTLEDMVQEGRLSLIKAVYKYDMNSKYHFSTYAAAAVKKNFYSKIRNSIKRKFCCSLYSITEDGIRFIDTLKSDEDIEEYLILGQQYDELWRAVGELSDKEKSAVVWYYMWEASLKEYALSQKISYKAAAARKRRAVIRLKDIMNSAG